MAIDVLFVVTYISNMLITQSVAASFPVEVERPISISLRFRSAISDSVIMFEQYCAVATAGSFSKAGR